MNTKTCCFTGHRILPGNKIKDIVTRLNKEIDTLIKEGYTEFISGAALGFDSVAAMLVADKKKQGKKIRLIYAVPCNEQNKYWPQPQKDLYEGMLSEADEVVYVSDKNYFPDCMKKRNQYMVDHADCVIACLCYNRGGTFQTVNYAKKKGVKVVNVGED